MSNHFCSIVIGLFALSSFGQTISERTIYLDSTFAETNKPNHVYYRVIADQSKNRPPYKTTDYYKSGKVYSEGYSTNKNHLSPVGQFTEYYESGGKKIVKSYNDGTEIGSYFRWYENGNPLLEGDYVLSDAKDDKIKILKISQFWDAKNVQTIKDGNGHYDLVDEEGHDEGDIKNGFREGMWQGSDSLYQFTYIEKYANNQLVSGISTDKLGLKRVYHEVTVRPDFAGGIGEFYNYIGRNYKVPEMKTAGGKIFISFYIEQDGSLDHIKIIRGLAAEFNQEAYRVLAACPDWIPGKKRGVPVRVLYSLPINIHVQD